MVMNGDQFLRYATANHDNWQRQPYDELDQEMNGDPRETKELSNELEQHPIGRPGMRGLIGCH